MTYAEAVAYLDSLAQFGWKLDLARIERLCKLAGHPERRWRKHDAHSQRFRDTRSPQD